MQTVRMGSSGFSAALTSALTIPSVNGTRLISNEVDSSKPTPDTRRVWLWADELRE